MSEALTCLWLTKYMPGGQHQRGQHRRLVVLEVGLLFVFKILECVSVKKLDPMVANLKQYLSHFISKKNMTQRFPQCLEQY